MKYKSYSRGRGPGRLKGSAYKRHMWKQREKGGGAAGRGGGSGGRGRGRPGWGKAAFRTEDTCFKCGNKGHWASQCTGMYFVFCHVNTRKSCICIFIHFAEVILYSSFSFFPSYHECFVSLEKSNCFDFKLNYSMNCAFFFSLTYIFAWLTKIATKLLLIVKHQSFCNGRGNKPLNYLIYRK